MVHATGFSLEQDKPIDSGQFFENMNFVPRGI